MKFSIKFEIRGIDFGFARGFQDELEINYCDASLLYAQMENLVDQIQDKYKAEEKQQ